MTGVIFDIVDKGKMQGMHIMVWPEDPIKNNNVGNDRLLNYNVSILR